MEIYNAILVFLFGSAIGSFLNVVILRLPNEQKLTGRSHCPQCGHELAPWELIPLLSYIFLLGKCSNCKEKISPRYFIIELITALLFIVGWWLISPQDIVSWLLCIQWFIVAAGSVAIFVIDFEHFLILDTIVFPLLLTVVLLSFGLDLASHHVVLSLSGIGVRSLLGAAAGALPFFLVWYFSNGLWMGFGDVKLMLFLGAAAGLPLVVITILLAVFSGGIVSVFLLLLSKKTLKSHIPLGTFLSAAGLATLLWGQIILHWYLGILGF